MKTVPPEAPWTAPKAARMGLPDAGKLDPRQPPHQGGARVRPACAARGLGGRGATGLLPVVPRRPAQRRRPGIPDGRPGRRAGHEISTAACSRSPERLAAALGERVVLSAPVERIVQDEAGVRACHGEGRVRRPAPDRRRAAWADRPHRLRAAPARGARRPASAHAHGRDHQGRRRLQGRRSGARLGFSGQVATDDDALGLVYGRRRRGTDAAGSSASSRAVTPWR